MHSNSFVQTVWPQSEFLDFQQISLLLYIFYAAVSLFESHIKSITYSYFHLQVLNFKDRPQVKSLLCLHMEKLAVCWHHCQSAHTGMTRLKNPGNQPALLPDAVWFWAGETADTLTRLITAARCTHCINASLLFCSFSWKKGVMKYLRTGSLGLHRCASLSVPEKWFHAGERWPEITWVDESGHLLLVYISVETLVPKDANKWISAGFNEFD